jgi:transaldolase
MGTTVKPTTPSDSGKPAQNPLKELTKFGQSVWLDYIRRDLFTSGELKRFIEEDGLRGMTSNPSIFEKAIAGSDLYANTLADLEKRKDLDAKGRYEELAIKDIQDAADFLRPVYQQTKKRDGYVSLEVSPYLAHKTQETLDEARRLWKRVGRENLMVKVPGTPEGIPAFQQLISEGININVTLLFAFDVYVLFISRIDTLVDGEIDAKLKASTAAGDQALLRSLHGKVAIANGKLTYQRYKQIFSGPRWDALASRGAQTQRVLWASTSTKNPAYSDVYYVEELIGPDTVNTIPPATFDAFRNHGKPRASLEENVQAAQETMQGLEKAGISMKAATDKLTAAGVNQFSDDFDKLLDAVKQHAAKAGAAS